MLGNSLFSCRRDIDPSRCYNEGFNDYALRVIEDRLIPNSRQSLTLNQLHYTETGALSQSMPDRRRPPDTSSRHVRKTPGCLRGKKINKSIYLRSRRAFADRKLG
ncbi:jg7563 [Pararge aegeria aegeria]|uniref:Jg7563 protein n=1 Tax=Pararge aegeria aegeria TaxID=348720 RepID=A0A8S4QYP3_9NEOP|nr:jg7563 [Pararge aegeria aegeria]